MAASDNYAPGIERVQVTAAPNLATVQAKSDPSGDRVGQLMRSLGVAGPALEDLSKKMEATDAVNGTMDARGMTLEEQSKKINSGELLASHSPSYVAAVQHIYGQNLMDTQQRNTMDKIARGELTFATTEEVGAYLTNQRNEALSGQSKYTTAGFDKSFDQFASTISSANSQRTNAAFIEEAQRSADELIHNSLDRVQSPGFTGSVKEKAASILNELDFGQATNLIPRAQSKETIKSLLNSVAESGDVSLMKELLDSPTMDGHRLSSIVGGAQARLFSARTTGVDDANQRQRMDIEIRPFAEAARKGELNQGAFDAFIKPNERWITTGTIEALQDRNLSMQNRLAGAADKASLSNNAYLHNSGVQASVAAAVESGSYARLPAQMQMSSYDNTLSPIDTKPIALAAIESYAERTKMGFDDKVHMYTAAGLTNPAWEKIAATGISNIASVGQVYDGKPPGVLNPQGEEGIKLLRELKRVDPSSVAAYAGSQSNAKDFETIDMLMITGGAGDLNAAATLVNAGKHSGITAQDFSLKQAQITKAVSDLSSPNWYSGITGAFGSDLPVNESETTSHLRDGAEALLRAGRATTGQQAVDMMREYAANPAVTTVINNTRYYNTQLPAVPQGANTAEYVNKFINEKVLTEVSPSVYSRPSEFKVSGNPLSLVASAFELGMGNSTQVVKQTNKPAPLPISLHREPGGNFTALIGGLPATTPNGSVLIYTKKDIEGWIAGKHLVDIKEAATARNKEMVRQRADAPLKEMRDAAPASANMYSQ